MSKISCIIPTYNEGPRIAKVLEAVHGHPMVNEIIVVNDGSKDDTREIVGRFNGVKLISHEKNIGKSKAVAHGLIESSGDIIILLDADLIGLTPRYISDLIEPVISGKADVAISIRENSLLIFRMFGLDFVSGERVFHKELVADHTEDIQKLANFGLETYLNRLIIKNGCRIQIVSLKNLISPRKFIKTGFVSGIRGDYLMIKDILKTASVFEIIYQFIKMEFLRVK